MRNLVIALALLLAACATGTMERVTVACNGYAATLNSLTAYKMAGRLSDEQIATVDMWEPLLTASCTGDPNAVTGDLLDQIDAAMFALIEVQRNAK